MHGCMCGGCGSVWWVWQCVVGVAVCGGGFIELHNDITPRKPLHGHKSCSLVTIRRHLGGG